MRALLNALHEIYGLFVEDGSYAIAILVWVGLAALIFPRVPAGIAWRGPLLFIGLAALMIENVVRAARK